MPLYNLIQANRDYVVRTETFQGRNHTIVPVVMMVEGVHSGSLGPLLHLAEDLGRFPASWNGIPVMVDHPEQDGQFISANTPGVIEQSSVGTIFNTRLDGTRLRAEAWLEEHRLSEFPQVVEHIRRGLPLEVSLGMYTEEEATEGDWNGEHYNAIARNHRPDHLALLPGGVGACSWTDGCGIRANKKGGNDMEKNVIEALKEVRSAGYAVSLIANGDQGYRELMDLVYSLLNSMDTEDNYHYLEELYDDSLVYSKSGKLYKQAYKVSDGVIELIGSPLEVRKEVKFIANSGMTRTKFNSNSKKEAKIMSDKEKPCCEDLVDELIANSRTKFTAEDKESLLALEEAMLVKLIPEKEKEPVVEANKGGDEKDPPQINAETIKQWMKDSSKSLEAYLEMLPDEVADQIKTGLRTNQEQRTAMVTEILNNTKVFTEDELKAMKTDMLVKTYKAVCKEEVDFSLNAAGGSTDSPASYGEMLLPAGMEKKEDK